MTEYKKGDRIKMVYDDQLLRDKGICTGDILKIFEVGVTQDGKHYVGVFSRTQQPIYFKFPRDEKKVIPYREKSIIQILNKI